MIAYAEQHIRGLLETLGFKENISLSIPPKPEMGDIAFPVFQYAKEKKMSPVDAAKELAAKFNDETEDTLVERAEAFGPYVNFFLNDAELARIVLNLSKHTKPEVSDSKGTIMIEYACPNTHKIFHIGHLRNVALGESLVRLHEYAGYRVIRANYQGDVGLHIAKCLWGIEKLQGEYDAVHDASLKERMKFIGKAYAYGATAFETDESVKAEVQKYNAMIYEKNAGIEEVYTSTRAWSLEYLESVYMLLNTKFDRYYFESEVFSRAIDIVRDGEGKGIFEMSQGAIIFKGSDHGLHDRVFLNSAGFPTYEAKDLALAEKQFSEFHPDHIYHIIGPEQSEYLKVLFKALEEVLPESAGREHHLPYGSVILKSGKMSSRTGQVISAEDLIDEAKAQVKAHMDASEVKSGIGEEEQGEIVETVALAAIKYAFLKTGRQNTITFDLHESVSTAGDSGPYLLYLISRFRSILGKTQNGDHTEIQYREVLEKQERELVIAIGGLESALEHAIAEKDPSLITQYLFDTAQKASRFYHECPVLEATPDVREFRLMLIRATIETMETALDLLGIKTVQQM